jgi:four helix bundle protein
MDKLELQQRTRQFALRVLKLTSALGKGPAERAIASQLARSGTSVAANYRSACRARTRLEFIVRLGVVEEEADESLLWMELIVEGGFVPAARVRELRHEADALVAIMAKSRQTAARNVRTAAGARSAAGNRQSATGNRQ